MAAKRPTASLPAPKRRRKTLTIAEKVRLLDMLQEEGKSYAAVGRHYGLNESSVRYIKKDERNIRATAGVTRGKTAKRVVTSRNQTMSRTENALAFWIGDCRKKNIQLNTLAIREKARQLHARFSVAEEEKPDEPQPGTSPAEFMASKGWFERFQKRFNLKSVPLNGDPDAAKSTEQGGDRPAEETGVPRKKRPARTFIVKEGASEGAGLTAERLTDLVRSAGELQRKAAEWDDNMVRALRFRDAIDGAVEVYRKLLRKTKEQLPVTEKAEEAPPPPGEEPAEALSSEEQNPHHHHHHHHHQTRSSAAVS